MEDYVSFEQAKALKELGFNWHVEMYFVKYRDGRIVRVIITERDFLNKNVNGWGRENKYSRPSLDQVAKWLREKGYHIQITPNMTWRGWRILLFIKNGSPEIYDSYEGYKFDTYEKALSAGIDLALKYLK